LLRDAPDLDLVRVQDVGLTAAGDPTILDWAAGENRLLLRHDYETVPKYAYERVNAGLPMPGVIVGDTYLSVQQAIQDILLLAHCSREGEWEGQVVYLPIK
jgi:hypothetical protein